MNNDTITTAAKPGISPAAGTEAAPSAAHTHPSDPPDAAPAARRSRASARNVERSCVVCHRRKVRCDKKLPCATCRRNGVLCCYPPGDRPPPRRQPKSTIADIAARLVQLEKTLVAISGDPPLPLAAAQRERRASVAGRQAAAGDAPRRLIRAESEGAGSSDGDEPSSSSMASRDEILVEHGASSRYINEVLLSRVLEEEEELQSAMASPGNNEAGDLKAASVQPFSIGGLLPGSFAARMDLRELYPSPFRGMQLWNFYVSNVDSISKILHIPTAQVEVYTAISNQYDTTPEMHCLLFAVFFAATVAMDPEDVLHMLGHDKVTAFNNFKQGLELSLSRADFLEAPTGKSIQAFALFLKMYRSINSGRAVWILSGVALRAAKSIGLHRDGTKFGMPPFECEMRRRLFWFVNSLDARAIEDFGLVVAQDLDRNTDVELPLNVGDAALRPGMAELPPPVAGWTEISLSLSMYHVGITMRRLQQMMTGRRPGSAAESQGGGSKGGQAAAEDDDEQSRRRLVDALRARVDAMFRDCSAVVPQQRTARLVAQIVVRKLDFVSRQQVRCSTASPTTHRRRRRPECTDESLAAAAEVLELNWELGRDEMLRAARWTSEAFPQYDVLLYVLWALSLRPRGAVAERAWAAVDGAFAQERSRRERQQVQTASGVKWSVIKAMRDRALLRREEAEKGTAAAEAPAVKTSGSGSVVNVGEEGLPEGAVDGHPDLFPAELTSDGHIDIAPWCNSFMDWASLLEDFSGQDLAFQ